MGPAGKQIYNTTHSVMQYCNGTNWVNMGAANVAITDGDKGAITVSSSGTAWAIDASAVTNTMLAGAITISKLDTTGTASSSTYLRGDAVWTTVVGLTDSDKGDITVSSSGTAWAIDSGAVSLAKMANMATASLLGRNTAGTGTPEVLSAATVKSLLSLNNVENTALSTWAGSSNITTLGTISGTLTATTFSGSGASLTSLSASNLSTGTVATARLGSGTADSTSYLRGDGTWAAPSSSVPQGTWCGAATRDVSSAACTTGTYTSIATCNGSSVVSSCPSGYTHTNVSIFANDYCGEASCPKYYCTRTCIKN